MSADFKALGIGAVVAIISTTIWYYTSLPPFVPLWGCCLATMGIAIMRGEHRWVVPGPKAAPFVFATMAIAGASAAVTFIYLVHAIVC